VRYETMAVRRTRGTVSVNYSSHSSGVSHRKRKSLLQRLVASLVQGIKKRKEERLRKMQYEAHCRQMRAEERKRMRQEKKNAPYAKIKREAIIDIVLGMAGIFTGAWLIPMWNTGNIIDIEVMKVLFGFLLLMMCGAGMIMADGIGTLLATRKGKLTGIVKESLYMKFFVILYIIVICMGIMIW